ncbi:MAG TPA: carbohydrate ABC transporter permease [Microlunatus sp.]
MTENAIPDATSTTTDIDAPAGRRFRTGVSAAAPARVSVAGKRSGRAFTVVSWVVLIVFAVLWLIPSLWAIKTSLTSNATTAIGAGPILKDWNLTLESYKTLLTGGDIWNWYLASFVTSILTVFFGVLFAAMAAYAISRMQFRGRDLIFLLLIGGILVPPQVLIVPVFQELNLVGLLNTYWAVVLPQIPTVIALFVFKQFFDGIPRDFEESARIDGAGYWRVFRSIILPLSRPVLAAMSIVTFVGTWNNLILPLFVLSNPKLMTIPVGLATVQGSYGQRLSDIQASSILGSLPLVILFLIFQRRIVEGFAGSGLKG